MLSRERAVISLVVVCPSLAASSIIALVRRRSSLLAVLVIGGLQPKLLAFHIILLRSVSAVASSVTVRALLALTTTLLRDHSRLVFDRMVQILESRAVEVVGAVVIVVELRLGGHELARVFDACTGTGRCDHERRSLACVGV